MSPQSVPARWRPLIGAGLTVVLAAVACSRPAYVGTDGVRVGGGRPAPRVAPRGGGADSAPSPDLTRKLVAGKEPPSILIARDGTRCTVTARRYAETREGDYAWCAW